MKCLPWRWSSGRFVLVAAVISALTLRALSQTAPLPSGTAADLTKYDRNRNGALDPDERAQMEADRAKAARAVADTEATDGETVVMSPFEVRPDSTGYYAANTMSGTRLNAKVEDLASSISVVTKEQMRDFAMLDINDVFLYEANTEGTGTYTDVSIDRNGSVIDNVQFNPTGANRIRGVGSANIALGNFETSGRVPIDPTGIDSIEISRGPNSSIFGVGNVAGTVNMVASSANLNRNRSLVDARWDSYDGYRGSIDLNRVLFKDTLAVRVSAVRQHEGFVRKPSGTDTDRFNAMLKFRPFKGTTLSASYSLYKFSGTRANATTPKDNVSYWRDTGRATWDPTTFTAKIGTTTVGPLYSYSYPGFPKSLYWDFVTYPSLFVGQSGVEYWQVNITSYTNNPSLYANPPSSKRYTTSQAEPVRTNQPLFATTPSVTDQDMYDWTEINLASVNRQSDRMETSTIQLEQIFLNTPRQMLAAQLGWFREKGTRSANTPIGVPGAVGAATGFLNVDTNEKNLDGTPNPYFLRPYIGVYHPAHSYNPICRDNFRLQLAYRLDLSRNRGWTSWLGAHQLSGYGEYKDLTSRRYVFRNAIVSDHEWLPAGVNRASQTAAAAAHNFVRFYVGDNSGYDIDYAPTDYANGRYVFNWYNGTSKQWVAEAAELGAAASADGSGGANNIHTILRTQGAVLQSHLWKGKIVTTFGLRRDQNNNQTGVPVAFLADQRYFDYDTMNRWSPTWVVRKGETRTGGVVVKPFRDSKYVNQQAERRTGLGRLLAEGVRGLSLHYNRSDSFQPTSPAQTVFRVMLPDPTGEGEDYGFTLNLFDNKFVLRANHYKTVQKNSRNGESGTLAQRSMRVDFNWAGDRFSLNTQAAQWITADAAARGVVLTADQLDAEVAKVMGLTKADLAQFLGTVVSDTSDIVARGNEIELNFTPNRYWRLRANLVEQESLEKNLSPNLPRWLEQRLPVWQKVVDPRTGELWWNTNYGGSQTAAQYYASVVATPLRLAQAMEGKSRPQIRRYRANVSTNVQLAGLFDAKHLKRMSVGGALRWEDKGAIGYYGVQELPAVVTDLDPNRPIWNSAHLYVDLMVGYRTRLFKNRVGATFQLNVKNVQEGGRLQKVGAYPNGRGHTYRIIDPRQFILSASFDL